jgi:hypothetical protein
MECYPPIAPPVSPGEEIDGEFIYLDWVPTYFGSFSAFFAAQKMQLVTREDKSNIYPIVWLDYLGYRNSPNWRGVPWEIGKASIDSIAVHALGLAATTPIIFICQPLFPGDDALSGIIFVDLSTWIGIGLTEGDWEEKLPESEPDPGYDYTLTLDLKYAIRNTPVNHARQVNLSGQNPYGRAKMPKNSVPIIGPISMMMFRKDTK